MSHIGYLCYLIVRSRGIFITVSTQAMIEEVLPDNQLYFLHAHIFSICSIPEKQLL